MSQHIGWIYKDTNGREAVSIRTSKELTENAVSNGVIFRPQRLYTEKQMREIINALREAEVEEETMLDDHGFLDPEHEAAVEYQVKRHNAILEKYREVLE